MNDVFVDEHGRLVSAPTDEPLVIQQARLRKLHGLVIDRVDLVRKGANPGARVLLCKSADALALLAQSEGVSAPSAPKKLAKAERKAQKAIAKADAARAYPALPQGSNAPRTANLTTSSAPTIAEAPRTPPPAQAVRELARSLQQQVGATGGYISGEQAIARALDISTPAEKAAYRAYRLEVDGAQINGVGKSYDGDGGNDAAGYMSADEARGNVSRPVDLAKTREDLELRDTPIGAAPVNKAAGEIYELRKSRAMTQWELGQELGVNQQYVSRLENGEEQVPSRVALQLARIFGKSIDWVYEISGSKPVTREG